VFSVLRFDCRVCYQFFQFILSLRDKVLVFFGTGYRGLLYRAYSCRVPNGVTKVHNARRCGRHQRPSMNRGKTRFT